MRLEVRTRGREQEIFNTRAEDIQQVLSTPKIKNFFNLLPRDPRICDLFTGTGAGIKAVFKRLEELGKPPSQIVGIDDFRPEDEILNPSMISLYDRAKYPLSQAETERNLSLISATILTIKRRDGLDYLRQFSNHPFPFDLVTGFSIPLHSKSDEDKFEKMIGIIPKECTALFTFGTTSRYHLDFLMQNLREEHSMQNVWKFYAKAQGAASPDWDTWIMTNRNLDWQC